MTLLEIKDKINKLLPDRTKASDPMYAAGVVRGVLFEMLDFAAGLIDFVGPNGDPNGGAPVVGYSSPGKALLRLMGNLIAGISEVALINLNLAGDGFSFWQMATATKRQLLMVIRYNGVGIGTNNPEEKLHVTGRVKSAGLVASGAAPVAFGSTGLGGGSVKLRSGSTDQCGQITLVTGSNPTSNDIYARITYSAPLPAEPVCVLLTPRNQAAAREQIKVVLLADSNSSLVVFGSNNGSALSANSSFDFNYFVVV